MNNQDEKNKLQSALTLARLGYKVFPCIPGGKIPAVSTGLHSATTDEKIICNWWRINPEYNVAINCDGLIVIDSDNPQWPENDNHRKDIFENSGAITCTPRVGFHFFYRSVYGSTWKNSTSFIAKNVDVKTYGGYVVCPNSDNYYWKKQLSCKINELPEPSEWLKNLLTYGEPEKNENKSINLDNPLSKSIDNQSDIIIEGSRNSTLTSLAGSLRRIGLSYEAILAALIQTNYKRCKPCLEELEIKNIANSVCRYEINSIAQSYAENSYENKYLIDDNKDDEKIEFIDNLQLKQDELFPKELLNPGGFISEVISYSLKTAPYPEPILSFSAAVCLMSVLCARKIRDQQNNRSNLYLFALANSGTGKDHSRRINTEILFRSGFSNSLGSNIASGEGLEDKLGLCPSVLFQIDEIDGLFQKLSTQKESRHESIVSMLLTLYSSAASTHIGRSKAGKEPTVINQPSLTIYGTAVPSLFYSSVSERLASNGLLARTIVIEAGTRAKGQETAIDDIPEEIINKAKKWFEYKPNLGNLSDINPVPVVFRADESALKLFHDYREEIDEHHYKKAEQEKNHICMSVWARALEKAKKLSLIHAASNWNFEDLPLINELSAQWGISFSRWTTKRTILMIERHSYISDFDNKRKKLLAYLIDELKKGIEIVPMYKIYRAFPWSKKEHEDIRQVLVEQKVIEIITPITKKAGRKGTYYKVIQNGDIK